MDSQQSAGPGSGQQATLRTDRVIVALVVVAAAVIFAQMELNEWLFERTRHLEALQVDEAPAVLFVLASCMSWFAWRRYREARLELGKRQAAEQRLASLLLENRRLAQQYLQAQEAERKSVARELHDELGQYLNAIKTDAVSMQEQLSDAQRPRMESIIRHIDHLHAVVRDLIRELRPVALDELGLQAALEHYLDQRQQRMPAIRINVALEGDLDSLGEPLNLTIYRLTQEALTNVFRHSRAGHVAVRVARTGPVDDDSDAVTFTVSDDGRGADPGETNGGLGLIGMRERVEMLGGQWRVTSARDRGFSLFARIPVGEPKGATP